MRPRGKPMFRRGRERRHEHDAGHRRDPRRLTDSSPETLPRFLPSRTGSGRRRGSAPLRRRGVQGRREARIRVRPFSDPADRRERRTSPPRRRRRRPRSPGRASRHLPRCRPRGRAGPGRTAPRRRRLSRIRRRGPARLPAAPPGHAAFHAARDAPRHAEGRTQQTGDRGENERSGTTSC